MELKTATVNGNEIMAVIEPLGMKSYPFIMAKNLETGKVEQFHMNDLVKEVTPAPGKGITFDNRVVEYVPEDPDACET